MPFLEDSQITALELKDKINLKAVLDDIQSNTSIEYSANIEAGNRSLPMGSASPFMIVEEQPSIADHGPFCSKIGIDKSEVYRTYILKYPTSDKSDKIPVPAGKEHVKAFLHREIFAVNPEIVILVGDYAQKVFSKTYDLDYFDGVQKVVLPLKIKGNELKYETYVAYLPSLDAKMDAINPIINRIKLNWKFVHLHTHNSLSLKDGVGSPASRVKWHVANKKPAIATSNHGNISDWYKIYEGAHENGMKPILGMEAYFNRDAEKLQEVLPLDTPEAKQLKKKLRSHNRHVTMFAKNETGFFNLIKIHNDAWINRFYRNPIISPEMVAKNKEGIFVLSGCATAEQNRIITDKYYLKSEERKREIDFLIAAKLKSMTTLFNTKNDERASEDESLDELDLKYFYTHQLDKKFNKEEYEAYARDNILKADNEKIETADKRVRAIIDWWKNLFGNDYYIELMVIDYAPQRYINEELIKVAIEKNVPIVITNDCHYLTKAEANIQQMQMLSDQEKTFKQLEEDQASGANKIWTIKSKEFYYKTVDELYEAWAAWCKSDIFTEEMFWKAINNTISIVDKIETWELDRTVKLPKLHENGKEVLLSKCREGMDKYGLTGKKEYEERLEYELSVIIDKGYVDYFLIVEDIVKWVKDNYGRRAVGPGRGSAAGGLVNYVIGLTYVDPIKYKLLFERFLDPAREDLPDIDQDIQPRIRDNVIQHMIDTYGAKSVCPIGTYGNLKTRSAILDACRVVGIEPQEVFGVTTELPKDLDETKSLEELEAEYPALKKFLDSHDRPDSPLRFFIKGIKGAQKSVGTHAAGVLISSNVLSENIPLIRSKKTIVTGWIDGEDGRELSGLNYAKMDVLGLKNLEVIDDCVRLIKERLGIEIDVDKINLDDPKVYKNVVNAGDAFGVFQFESGLASQLIEKIHPDKFMELADISALMRPGPLSMGIPDMYANRKHGRADEKGHVWTPEDIPACIRDILIDSYGLIIYQEHIMQIAERIGGHTRAETNKLRKLLIKYGKFSKGNPEYEKNIGKYHEKFIKHASEKQNLGSVAKAEELWDLMAAFAAYGFNKSHSVSYTVVSMQEYWLKTYYRAEFSVALINNTDVKKEKKGDSVMAQYITAISRSGMKIIRPSINLSKSEFSLTADNRILWGLSAIKGVTYTTIDKIMEARNKYNCEDGTIKPKFFKDMAEALERVGKKYLNKRTAEALIWSGAFDDFMIDNVDLKDRFDIHRSFFVDVRQEKKYEEQNDQKSPDFIIKKEIDLCKFSLSEMRLFNKCRKTYTANTGNRTDFLYEIDEKGSHRVIARLVKIEHRISKRKTPFLSFTLRDDTAIMSGISYFYPWGADPEDDPDKMELMEPGKIYYFTIEHNDKGFKNLKKYSRL